MRQVVVLDDAPLREFARTLERTTPQATKEVRATIARGALEIKRRMQSEATGEPRFRRVAASISYDTFNGVDVFGADVGPEVGVGKGKGRSQGGVAGFAYEGSAVSGPVFPDPQGALESEAKVVEEHIANAVAKLL